MKRSTMWPTLSAVVIAGSLLAPMAAQAVPSFARQTGLACAMCHTVFPQLTPYGRLFKLTGYTTVGSQFADKTQNARLSEDIMAPLSAMLQVSYTSLKTNANGAGTNKPGDSTDFPQQFSLFYAGRVSSNVGAFVQATLDNTNAIAMDNADVRFADQVDTASGKQLIYGLSLNNAPTVEDIFNTTPVWAAAPAATSAQSPSNAPAGLLLLGSDNVNTVTTGAVAYALFDNNWYGAAGMYHNNNGAHGSGNNAIKGWAPYVRLAYQQDNGTNNWSVGAYTMSADMTQDPTDTTKLTSKVADTGIDGQYQYLNGVNTFTGRVNYISEKVSDAANMGATATGSVTMSQASLTGTYFYDRRYGGSIGYFSNTGDANGPWGTSNKPDSSYWMAEYDYVPWLNTRFSLQYTAYNKVNGATSGASDSNTLYALAWFMF